MSKIKFSPKQEEAINAVGKNYLISAGAGSGKTAVLSERIYRISKENRRIDNFLVLTFTNFAAGEMKDRVRKLLLDDPDTTYLASEVDNSHIETFDSFSLYLAKKYYYKLNISKDISIVDNSILSIKRRIYLDEVFDDLYINEDKKFLKLIDTYAIKNDNGLKDFVISLLESSDKKADNIAYLNSLRNDFFNEEFIDNAIQIHFNEIRENLLYLYKQAEQLMNAEDATNICAHIDNLLSIDNYDKLYEVLSEPTLSKFPTKKGGKNIDDDFRKKIADYYNKKVKATSDNDFGNSEQIKAQYLSIKPYVQKVIDIALEVERKLTEFKKLRNAYSFGDISRFVLKLIEIDEIREEIKSNFDYIMIDEYQDTNDIQDKVISSISKNNIYMVGDVKQSIYRFRGADCHIFQKKFLDYQKGIGGEEKELNTSYRSREEVVNFINELFEQLMNKEINAIDYKNGHIFEYGQKDYKLKESKSSYSPEVYEYEYEKSDECVEKEIDIIIKDIKNKKKNGYQVFDKDTKGNRDCDYKDFAIIIDRGTTFDKYRKRFAEANIPLKVQAKDTLFKSDVIYTFKNLVKMLYYSLNNEYEGGYRHSYMSVARSFLLEYKDDKLYEIFKNKSYLNESFAQKIELIKESLRYSSIKNIFIRLIEEFDIYDSISKITQYYGNTHKLESLINIASMMDSLNYNLEEVVKYFDDLAELDLDIAYSDSDKLENSVTLINIHQSKGLEYPIIYFPGLNKKFSRMDLNTAYIFSDTFGAIMPSAEDDHPSLIIRLIKNDLIKADFEEKIRLLYVALTRAKEKIILINGKKPDEIKFYKPVNASSMSELLALTDVLNKYKTEYSLDNIDIEEQVVDKVVEKIKIKKIEVPSKKVIHLRASKEVDEEVEQSVLDFGSELHAYLEKMDLDNRSLEFIKNRQMRKYVYNVMNSSLFNNVKNSQVRHEYRFYDEDNGIQGYIDALIIKENEIDIVDFKLKNIDEIEYDKQLRVYKSYISKITDLPIRMYLLAALTGEVREVKDE